MKSSEFRKAYAGLSEVTTVEANGHVIGTWVPVGKEMVLVAASPPAVRRYDPIGQPRYDERPLTAVPKPGRRQR